MNFLKKVFAKKPEPTRHVKLLPCRPEHPVCVIGDIHGCLEMLENLFTKIDAADHIVTVGDYVDRGEDSAGVLVWLKDAQSSEPGRVTCLMGNHEVMMLEFLDDPTARGRRWLGHGGLQTLASFGVRGARELMSEKEAINIRDQFRDVMPDGLEDWVRNLPKSWVSGNLWIVHAGADPFTPMPAQQEKTFLWGHRAFLNEPRIDGIWVAHGHTVINPPEQTASRIAVDTGAYHSGRLTAARCLPNGEVYFIQVSS